MPIHIRKYDVDYSRQFFLNKMSKGLMGAGVLTSLWPLVGESADITKAYPEELLSIDAFTQGKLKTGDTIDASNVEIVKDLLDPIAYAQVSQQGRRIKLVPTTTDVTQLFPHDFLKATLSNQGKGGLMSTVMLLSKAVLIVGWAACPLLSHKMASKPFRYHP